MLSSWSGQLQVAEHRVGDVERLEEQPVLRQFLWSDRLAHLPQAEVAQPLRPRPEGRHLGPHLENGRAGVMIRVID